MDTKLKQRNDKLKKHLKFSDRMGLRLTQIFCAVGGVLQEDLRRHPWKLLTLFTFIPLDLTLVLAGTLAYFALGITKRGREGRAKIVKSVIEPIDYTSFKHFFHTHKKHRVTKEFSHIAGFEPGAPLPPSFAFTPRHMITHVYNEKKETKKSLRIHWPSVRHTLYYNARVHALYTVRDWLSKPEESFVLRRAPKLSETFSKKAERMITSMRGNFPDHLEKRRAYCKTPAL